MSLEEALKALDAQEREWANKTAKAELLTEAYGERVQELEVERARIERTDKAIEVLNSYADARQADLQTKIERVVTHGLKTIFGDDMEFRVVAKQVGKRTSMDFVVASKVGKTEVETPIMDARGGGVAAVAGFVLRLVMLLLRKDARPVLFLDETFAQLSAEYEPALAEFIRELVEKTRVQVVLVTHSDAYADVADRQYRFKLVNGLTEVSET